MNDSERRRAGHWPTLLCAFLYLDASLMIWVMLGTLSNALSDAFGLSAGEKGLMVTLPILSGAAMRPVLGLLADRIGARRTALLGMAITAIPLGLGWLWVSSFPQLLVVGGLLGFAGASFAVAVPLVSRRYPLEQQGLALGLTGMGGIGAVVATVLAPGLVPIVGWRGVFGLALVPLGLVFALVGVLVREAPVQPLPGRLRGYLGVLRMRETRWYATFYAVTCGGFVGLTAFLPIVLRDQYGVDPVRAGMFATICAIAGLLLCPIGGYLSDRLGGVLVLSLLFVAVGFLGMRLSYLPYLESATMCLALLVGLLGMANGAVFQMVPQRFPNEIGVVTGLISAAGGIGGFVVPLALGSAREWTGRFGLGFFLIGFAGFVAAGLLLQASRQWNGRTLAVSGLGLRREPVAPTMVQPPLAGVEVEATFR